MRAVVRRRFSSLGSALLTLGAVLGTMCLLATVVAPLADVRPLIFLSGSMSPTIPAGSLALARTVEADAIRVGDIITVPSNGSYLTHRVVEVTHAPGKATVLLRGDGNDVVDAEVHEVLSAPRTEIWLPHAGTVIAWFTHAPGVYVLAAWVALVLGTLRRRTEGSDRPQDGPGRPTRPNGPKLLLVARRWRAGARLRPLRGGVRLARTATGVAVVAATPIAAPTPAAAAWADTVPVRNTVVRTATIAGSVATCTDLGSTVRLSWTAVAGATQYLISYGGLGADRVESEVVPATGPLYKDFDSAREGRFDVAVRFGSDSWVSARSAQVSYTKGNCG